MSRQQFAFYKSFDDVYQDLSDNQKIEFMNTLLDVQFLRVKIEDVVFNDVILKHVWNAQKHSLEKSVRGYLESQKAEKIKYPFFGVYDDNFTPLQTPSEGNHKEEKGEEKEKGEEEVKEKEEENNKEQIDYKNILEVFNFYADKYNLSKLREITGKRKNKLLSRFKENQNFKEILNEAFVKIGESSFLLGKNNRSWKVDFDWLIENDTNIIKICEDKYKDGNESVGEWK